MSPPDLETGIHTEVLPGAPLRRARTPPPSTLVIFGGTGNLTHAKLLPALYQLARSGALPDLHQVVAVGRRELTTEEYRQGLRDSLGEHVPGGELDEEVWERFSQTIRYHRGGLDETATFTGLRELLEGIEGEPGGSRDRIFYLAVPPALFPRIVEQLDEAGLIQPASEDPDAPASRVVVEKPIGRDLESAQELNELLGSHLDERQIYRIDHYLGKETVQNLLVLRFGNSIFENLWNRQAIVRVEIVATETIGVAGRGAFYDDTGVLRDIVQNHLLQVLALVAMEPPLSMEADDVRNAKVQAIRSLRRLPPQQIPQHVVRGQYQGYLEETGVAPDSRTPTFVALRAHVDNWRWQGVPFLLRAGKGLSEKLTEVAIHFRKVPLCLFRSEDACQALAPNVLRIRIQPEEGISLCFAAKVPGEDLSIGSVSMNMDYTESFGRRLTTDYQRLLLDCMRGDATLFARRDEVEWAWRWVTPMLEAWDEDRETPLPTYPLGSDGPEEAQKLRDRSRSCGR